MARIRTIKPAFFRHRRLYLAEHETGLPLRVAFAGLWTVCDREGRFRWEPDEIKLDCLPYDDVDFSRVLDALVTRGFVVRYASGDREYGCIPSFKSHQIINNRESASILPDPSEGIEIVDELTCQPRVSHASATRHDLDQGEGKGKEGKGSNPLPPSGDRDASEVKAGLDEIDQIRKAVWRQDGLSENQIGTKLVSTSSDGIADARAWLELGLPLPDILAAIAEAYDDAERRSAPIKRPWKYLGAVMQRIADDRNKPEPAAPMSAWDHPAGRASRMALIARGQWLAQWGPAPGMGGCNAPQEAQEAYRAYRRCAGEPK